MNKRTVSCYEIAWNMHKANATIAQICQVISRHQATVYRWLKKIKRIEIREFLKRKTTCKNRRPRARTPEYVIQKIVDIRQGFGWCGAKIRKELQERHNITLALSTIYRYLHQRFTKAAVGVRRYAKHQAIVTARGPREVVEHDTVDLGGKNGRVYAYTAIDIFTKEPQVILASNLEMQTGASVFAIQKRFYGTVMTHQSDNGSEFQAVFRAAVEASGSHHRYSRPHKKKEQSHIENFNKALRRECFPGASYEEKDIPSLQQQANELVRHYIHRRWHMGLPGMMTPQQFKIPTLLTQKLLHWH